MKQSKFFHESEFDKFFQILSDPTKIPHNFHIISRDTLQFEWSNHPLFMPSDCKTNIFLASFTTAHARLRLFSVLDRLGESVLYFDTDSIIFKTLKSDDLHYLPVGNYLGELTNEIKAEDGYIVEFVSGCPKNYAYCTLSGREECKVRGFTLNWTNSKVINFEAIKSIICTSQEKQIEVINPCKISKDSRKENCVQIATLITNITTLKIRFHGQKVHLNDILPSLVIVSLIIILKYINILFKSIKTVKVTSVMD